MTPSILLAPISVSPRPSTRTLRSTALLSLLVDPWTPSTPACCIHSLYISFGISVRPSEPKTETVKLVSILLLSVAPALMYYLHCWIATLNLSYGTSGTREGKHDLFFCSLFIFCHPRRSAVIRAPLLSRPLARISHSVSVLGSRPLRLQNANTDPCSGWIPNVPTPLLPFELSCRKSLSNRSKVFRRLLQLLP